MKRVFAVLLAALLVFPAVPASADAPRVAVDRTSVKAGDTLTVKLSGWAAGNVVVELCGNSARRGTADCAVTTSATTFVAAKKTATVLLTVAKPPIGCPCVVSARPVTGGTPVTTPVAVAGAGTLAAPETGGVTSSRRLTVTDVSVTGSGVASWFGGPAHRTLRFTVRNDGQAPVADAPLSLAAGRGADPTTIVAAPPLGTLQPGQERSYTTRFTLDGPAFGRYTIRGEITGIDEPIAFTGSTSSYPWAFPVLGALLVFLAFVRALRRPARPPVLPVDAPTPDRVISMNQVVAANVGHWRRVRDLDPTLAAASLTRLTGRPWSASDISDASLDSTASYTANDLLALSRVLSVPLPALLLPPTDRRYRIAAADPHELADQISVDGVELLRAVAPTDDPAYTDRVAAANRTFLG
ncbi:hypothetical protein [Actinomadura atramentaria]|uniref:hypothetical protein n=1 Tax=Actinomadura atramentaria TaxID=1990 RepID=UPI0003A9BFD6|nr:hypothetical protein [Actinomadura atramentaria]